MFDKLDLFGSNAVFKQLNYVSANDSKNSELANFVRSVNPLIDEINLTIQQYNEAKLPELKIAALKKIYKKQKEINDAFPLRVMNECPDYQIEMHNKLYSELNDKARRSGYKQASLSIYNKVAYAS